MLLSRLSIFFHIIYGDSIKIEDEKKNEKTLKLKHTTFQRIFKRLLREEKISFSNNHIFNKIYTKANIESFQVITGSNLRTPNDNNYHKFFEQIIKKISKAKYDEIKSKYKENKDKNINPNAYNKSIKEKIDKKKKLNIELNKYNFSVLDVFYYYRERVNYHNVDFIEDISDEKISDFCLNYIDFTLNFLKPFHDFITQSITHK